MFNKASIKFTVGFLAIILLSFGVIFATTYLDSEIKNAEPMNATAVDTLDESALSE